jgi:histidinol dehydrogenase
VIGVASIAGVDRFFRVGGAQAVAALAFGTETLPRVDKIVGPGNRFVAAAKAYVAGVCAIDFYAGPTEIVIVAGAGRPDWMAAAGHME